jgi:hypothetical protein
MSRNGILFTQKHLDAFTRVLAARDKFVLTLRDPLLSYMYWHGIGRPLDGFIEMLHRHIEIDESGSAVTFDLREHAPDEMRKVCKFFDVEHQPYEMVNTWVSKAGHGPTTLDDWETTKVFTPERKGEIVEAMSFFRERYDFPNL